MGVVAPGERNIKYKIKGTFSLPKTDVAAVRQWIWTLNLLIPFTLCHPISLSSILISPSRLQIYLPCAVFNVCISVFHLTVLQAGRLRVRFPLVILRFFIDLILPAALCSRGRLSVQYKWVPGIFLRGKGGRCVGLTIYHIHVPTVLKSGSLTLLENSGPAQDCTGMVLFLLFIILIFCYSSLNSCKHFLISPSPPHP